MPIMFAFEQLARHPGNAARLGRLTTPHGVVETPAFMPVGTAGSIKGVTPDQVRAAGVQIVLANTYHLHLRPGEDIVAALGGVAMFSGWSGPMLTDSGGFQVFSLARINRIDDEGVDFQSHVDGARLRLDPRGAIAIQNKLGADIIMAFDQCPPLPSPREVVEAAVRRTIHWARICRDCHAREDQWLFGIVQGGLHSDLRERCAAALLDTGFDGYAIGGLSVGETHEEMIATLTQTAPLLPADKPRYLMGVGTPRDIFQAVRLGVDMFDCVLPTRNGRNAYAFTASGAVRLRNQQHALVDRPMEEGCDCYACRHFSLAYIRHLFVTGEMLGPILASIHNLRFYQRFMERIRALIPEGRLDKMAAEFPVISDESDVSRREVME